MFAARVRCALRPFGRHPLIRPADRLEALAVVGMLVIWLIALPVAVSAGSLVHRSGLQTAHEESASRHAVQALVVSGVGLPTDIETPAHVRAQWREGAVLRTESVAGLATTKPGDQMTIWLDDDGNVVAAPMQPGDAELQAVVAGVAVWVCIAMLSALCAYLVGRGLDRVRARAWDRDLRLLTHNDDGWANRHI